MGMLAAAAPACVSVEIDSFLGVLAGLLLLGIPALGIPLIAWIARRHPSKTVRQEGKRPAGVIGYRCGLGLAALGVTLFVVTVIVDAVGESQPCDPTGTDPIAVTSTLLVLVGALLIGGGWAYAIRASWVVLATLALLDGWLLSIAAINHLSDDASVSGVLVLAFVLHAGCSCVAARWMFNGKNLGPIERAKAGEAGRSLSAVWIFLASYALLSVVRDENGVFESAAGSAVLGALTVGALAVTMGGGFTKYVEAIHAERPAPATDLGVTPGHGEDIED